MLGFGLGHLHEKAMRNKTEIQNRIKALRQDLQLAKSKEESARFDGVFAESSKHLAVVIAANCMIDALEWVLDEQS